MTLDERPLLAITMGDPAGIGPEVVVSALARRRGFVLRQVQIALAEVGWVVKAAMALHAGLVEYPLHVHEFGKCIDLGQGG